MRPIIIDHRMKSDDRRSWSNMAAFPLTDLNLNIIFIDRRLNIERRRNQLEVLDFEDVLKPIILDRKCMPAHSRSKVN